MSGHRSRLRKLERQLRERQQDEAEPVGFPWDCLVVGSTRSLTEPDKRREEKALREAEKRYAKAATNKPAWVAYREECARLGIEPRQPYLFDDFDPIEAVLRLVAIPSEPALVIGRQINDTPEETSREGVPPEPFTH